MILEESRQGPLTAKINDRYLHSRYSPQKEAEQFFERWYSDNGQSERVIMIEPGLGYLVKSVTPLYDRDNIFVIFLSPDTLNYCRKAGILKDIKHILFDSSSTDLPDLGSFLRDTDIHNTAVLEWPAGMQLFKNEGNLLREIIIKLFRIRQGNQITEKQFSRLWFSNGVSNFIRFDYSYRVGINGSPVLLCASGPSLEDQLKHIKKSASNYIVAALPSSLRSLMEHGIEADIVFSTDPGYYAKEHLKYAPNKALIISPLSAAACGKSNYLMGFLQNSPVESYILKKDELPLLPEMGTVAATAIDFLIKWKGNMPLYICGLDLCFQDIKMHASPHSFDSLILKDENRFQPGYSLYYDRASSMTDTIEKPYRLTKSMNTYQNWFSMQSFPSNVFRIAPETVELGIPVVNKIPSFSEMKNFVIERNRDYPDLTQRRTRIRNLTDSIKRELALYNKSGKSSSFLGSICGALSLDGTDYDKLSLLAEKWAEI